MESGRAKDVKKCFGIFLKTMKWAFIVFCVYLVSLFFREERLPGSWCDAVLERIALTNLVVRCDSIGVGFRYGLHVSGLRIYDRARTDALEPMAEVESIFIDHFRRTVRISGAKYPRLPDSYYAPQNTERNARVDCEFPKLPTFKLILERPDILAARPKRVVATVSVLPGRIEFSHMHLDWPDEDRVDGLDGFCTIDLDRQLIEGEVDGHAKQFHIRPMLVALDVPVSLPYMDGFTDVPEQVRATCGWKVNLVNNDFDLYLDLHPRQLKYNTIPMQYADGKIHLHSYTRGDCLNYRTEVGPITGKDLKGRALEGTVTIVGTNRYNTVDVQTASGLPVADLLKIGGFVDEYVGSDVVGEAKGKFQFRFPRSMTNNYEVLDGHGHVEIKDGHLLQLPLFAGLTQQLATHVPGVNFLVEQSQASLDYRIENGVLKTDNIYIEGGVFSIMMYGTFDAVHDRLAFTVRVQFMKKDSMFGKYLLHPLTWPFTKLLLEFRLTGSAAKPEWKYVSVLDRVLEVVK